MKWQKVQRGDWFECAPSPMNEEERPQSVDEAEEFVERFNDFKQDVWHRFNLTRRGRQKFVNWLSHHHTWFFNNFSKEQINRMSDMMFDNSI